MTKRKTSIPYETLKGNKSGTKLKEPEVRQEAFRQYLAHLAGGRSQESFVFEYGDYTITYKTMNRYIAENPTEFPSEKKEAALCKSFSHWESIINDMVDDKRKDKTALVQMCMRNKFGWDRQQADQNNREYASSEFSHMRKAPRPLPAEPDADNKASES